MSEYGRKNYIYICEDCGEPIFQRLDTIKNMINLRCKSCSSKKSVRIMCEKRGKDYCKKSYESTQYNLIGKNSLYYGLYNLGYTDKEISDICGVGLTCINSWRWRRNLEPNYNDSHNRNPDGTWIRKSPEGSRGVYLECRDHLYNWKYNILKSNNFTCDMCGSKNDLEVHHNKERFIDILNIFIPENKKELTLKEQKEIAKKVVEYHYKNNVSGITLCKQCHINSHRELFNES